MDKTVRRSQEQLAKCQEQIEQSHEIVAISMRWLTAYRNSVNNEKLRILGIYEGYPPLIANAKAVASGK